MQFQAPLYSADSIFPAMHAFSLRIVATAFLTAALAAATGCGSGVLATTAPLQNTAAPVASAKGPQLGYLWVDSDKTLRPILGVSGASQVGQSVVPAGVYVAATASATASIAVLQDTFGALDLMTLPSGSPVSLNVTLAAGAHIRISPGAAAALVYTPGSMSASLVTGLLSNPSVHAITAPGTIADSAVSDTGATSFEYTQGSSVAVAVMPLGGRATSIATVKSAGGLNFLPGHDDLLFADSTVNSLTLIRTSTTAPSTTILQTGQLLQSPTAVGVSASGRWALVANSASQSLVRVDLSTLAAISVACSCKPTLAAALADDGAFRVTDVLTGPNWIVDASKATPRLLFIPALPAPAKTSLVAAVTVP